MKKSILFLASLLVFATSCYEDYVRDFDYSAAFIAYQYDLRTFVLDEGQQFKVTVALSGVMQNEQDRNVKVEIDPTLLDADALTALSDSKKTSGTYVADAIKAAGLKSLTPLPADFYIVEGMDNLCIRKGSHTAAFTLKATEQMRNDANAYAPYYALGFRIKDAETDQLVEGKDFAVIVVKCENRFYGSWSRSGRIVSYDAAGNQLSENYAEKSLADQYCYNLTTVDGSSVKCDKVAGSSGEMIFTFEGNSMTISSADGKVAGTGSFDGSRLLQDRRLFLEYSVTADDGIRRQVTDTLYFRNRTRDGVNEWQDENPENYR